MAPACLYNSATDSAFTFLRCFLGTVLRRRPVTVNSRLSAESGGTGTVDNLRSRNQAYHRNTIKQMYFHYRIILLAELGNLVKLLN